ncbi:MAG: alpha-glucosidase [Treponema sp.]|nr:alpha-glucosidase [Treponema sp.]
MIVTQKKQWWKESVVYQIYPRSFQDSTGSGEGDLGGITSRLDYLWRLGIDVIWLSPVYASPMIDNGYDISNYEEINPLFGTMDDFLELLESAHRKGIKILMDLVVNHTSDKHPWFIESRSSRDNPKSDWYIWKDAYNGGPPNAMGSVFSGSAWQYDEARGQYYLHFFAIQQPDLNWDNPEVRHAVYSMMKRWFDRGVDGFRMDVINMISKFPGAVTADGGNGAPMCNGPMAHEYIREMNREVLSHYDIMTVGETPGVTTEEARKYAASDGSELNMVFQFEHMDLDNGGLGKWTPGRCRLTDLKTVLGKWQTELYGAAWNSLYWNNHDQSRVVSRFGDDSNENARVRSAKMLAACLHLMQGTPYIYQGEELGMTNAPLMSLSDCRDVEIFNAWRELVEEKKLLSPEQFMDAVRKRGRDNARTPMQWDSSVNGGFSSGTPWIGVNPNFTTINAASQADDPGSVFAFYQKLIRLRKTYPVIVHGDYEPLFESDERVFAYRRRYEGVALLVMCNFSGTPVSDPDFSGLNLSTGRLLLTNYSEREITDTKLLPWETRALLFQ